MATRRQPDRKVKYKDNSADANERETIVKPTDPKEEIDKLATGANHWGENELKLLRVSFPLTKTMNLHDVLQVDESEWSEDMRRRRIPFLKLS